MFPTAHKIKCLSVPGFNLVFLPGGGKAQIQSTVWLAPDVGTHASLILASRGRVRALRCRGNHSGVGLVP